MKELIPFIKTNASAFNIEPACIAAFISTESGGLGFDTVTGKIIIQFEPVWFKRKAPYAPSGIWSLNGVDVQSKEWQAFNNAFSEDQNAAMQATSIGLGQIMGFNYSSLGYKTVGEMWDDAKKSIDRQIWQMCKYISVNIKLVSALKAHDWDTVASIYNGTGYKALASKYHRQPYDETMAANYLKYKDI